MIFRDRADAGRQLAERLGDLRGQDVVVLGLPRGGVPVAAPVARALDAPLDVILVRKIRTPDQPELAMGAVGEGGVLVLDEELAVCRGPADVAALARRERADVAERAARFRVGRARVPVAGRVALVVDDGIATGASARAACRVARALGAARVVLAAPVCAAATARRLRHEVDELVCVSTPRRFVAVGPFYEDFTQTTDREVVALLALGATVGRPG